MTGSGSTTGSRTSRARSAWRSCNGWTTCWRRRGIARQLLDEAHRQAAQAGLARLALDTGLQNTGARRLYEAYGFGEREIREAPNGRTARALGGPGFVGYLKAV